MDENQIDNLHSPEAENAPEPTPEQMGSFEPEPGEFPDLEDIYEDGIDLPPDSSSEATATDPGAAADPGASVNAAILADLSRELATVKAQLDDRTTQSMRMAADFDNYRKRTQREREELEVQFKCTTIMELLPVVDNFERARSQIKPTTDEEMVIHKSYQGVYKQLVESLKRLGVAPMRSEGQLFDPNLHEAVMREPTREYEEGTVMEELVRGYTLGDRVLRHAMVKVAAEAEDEPTSESESPNE